MSSENTDFDARLRAAFPAQALDFTTALTGGTDGEFRNAVQGKPWTELDPSLIGRRSDVLSFLQPEHFVAVLPAFLRSLVTAEGVAMGVADTLTGVLDRDQEPRFDNIAAGMTDEQRAAVAEALEIFASTTTGGQQRAARHAINSWRKS